jgi:phosphoglycolate phosphatase-like HAD superfamily hydrolase
VHKRYGKEITTHYHPHANAHNCTLTRQTHIEQGTYQDYKTLSQFHYRTKRCPPPRKIFTLKRKNETAGTIVYSYPTPMCFGRTKAWKGTLQQLQQQISTISRVIIHPKYRSIGLGAKLVKETLPQAGTPYVEAVAVMARYNPFFEKAGMQRIAESKPNPHVTKALEQLAALGFDTALLAGTQYAQHAISEAGKETVTAILENLSKHNASTRRRLIGMRNVYPKHQEFTAKLHELDAAGLAKALKRLSFMAQTKVYLFWSKKHASG